MFDLGPAAREMNRLVEGVRDDQLEAPTPCTDWTLRELLAHVDVFTTVFTCNARKADIPRLDGLPDSWRTTIPEGLEELATAWREESAWQGRVSAGGVDMTGEQNALVAVEELVVHGWDVARASGQAFHVEDDLLGRVEEFQELFVARLPAGQGPYGPAVPVAEDASRLTRILGTAGRA